MATNCRNYLLVWSLSMNPRISVLPADATSEPPTDQHRSSFSSTMTLGSLTPRHSQHSLNTCAGNLKQDSFSPDSSIPKTGGPNLDGYRDQLWATRHGRVPPSLLPRASPLCAGKYSKKLAAGPISFTDTRASNSPGKFGTLGTLLVICPKWLRIIRAGSRSGALSKCG